MKEPKEDASGPAWGAQSFSAAKNKEINKTLQESGKDPGFGDFGRYFSEKKRKLRDQYHQHATASFIREFPSGTVEHSFSENIDSDEGNKLLFKGVSIFVDGFTTPTHQELRFLMMNHGGVFENYFSSQRVTHIICSTLPDSKIMNPRLMSRGVPIVKPEWIVDSIKENKLLSWDNYQLERIAYSHPHQRTLSASYSTHKLNDTSPLRANAVETIALHAVDVEKQFPVIVDSAVVPPVLDIVDEPNHTAEHDFPKKSEDVDVGQVSVPNLSTVNKLLEEGMNEELTNHGQIVPGEAVPERAVVQKQVKQKFTAGRGRSTLDDPDFVQSYFKYSRLHFIGTWRNRYQSLLNAGSFGNTEEWIHTDRTLSVASASRRPVIIHLDMDCFFVSVVVRNRPDLAGKPVAVCHSDSAQGTGEISSANYPARSYGIKAGMFVRAAKARCPELAIVPYDFAAYEQVADTVYNILHRHCSTVQAVSCDEAFLDVSGHPDPVDLASRIREEIFQATECPASAGIAENLLLARLATKKAKPNGQYAIRPNEVKEFMATLPLDQLPGVGWALQEKLHDQGLYVCSDLESVSKEGLQKVYGLKTGLMLWSYAQGIDDREVQPAQERKSIGAEVNWGVRFSCMDDAQQFLVTLSNEVAERMQKSSSSGRTITLKVKRRKEGVGEPVKFMGCGPCDNLSRSETVGYATNSAEILLRISRQLFASLNLDVQEVRGVGLQVSRLVSTNTGTRKQHNAFDSWLAPPPKLDTDKGLTNQDTENIQSIPGEEEKYLHKGMDTMEGPSQRQHGISEQKILAMPGMLTLKDVQMHDPTTSGSKKKTQSTSLQLPPLSQLDRSVLEFLPEDIVAEIKDANKAQEELKKKKHLDRQVDLQPKVLSGAQRSKDGQMQSRTGELKNVPRSNFLKSPAQSELPTLSQIDQSVLAFLPEDIVAEINHANKVRKERNQIGHLNRNVDIQPQVVSGVQRPRDGQLQSRTKTTRRKPRNSFLQLPPQSLLDPSVLESLPADILAEINHAYEQELHEASKGQFSSRSNFQAVTSGDTVSLNEKSPSSIPVVDRMDSGSIGSHKQSENLSGILESRVESTLNFGQRKSLKTTVYEDEYAFLQNILESVDSGNCRSLSTALLAIGSFIPMNDERDMTGFEQVIQQFFRLLIQYVQAVASKNLEEVHLILLYLKRLGNRCKLWSAVQELTTPAVKDVIGELYGGQLTTD